MGHDRSALLPFGTGGMRLAFKALEQIALSLGARWVMKIWFTVPRIPESARRQRVCGTTWGTGPTVYLVHGWAGWGLQSAAFVPHLLAAGFRLVRTTRPRTATRIPGISAAAGRICTRCPMP
ncbi:hypothetical protein ACXC9Q_22775 [Kribbella sp. CWNU-51]